MREYILTAEDYRKKYRNTIIGWRDEDGYSPYKIIDCQGDDGGKVRFVGLYLNRDNEWTEKRVLTTNRNLSLKWPCNGAINLKSGFVLYIKKRPRRQWRVALSSDIVHVTDLFEEERKEMDVPQFEELNNKGLLKAIFNPKYFTPEEAVQSVVRGKRVAAAWSPRWTVGAKFRSDKILIFRDTNPIGFTVDGTINIHESLSFLLEELAANDVRVRVYG